MTIWKIFCLIQKFNKNEKKLGRKIFSYKHTFLLIFTEVNVYSFQRQNHVNFFRRNVLDRDKSCPLTMGNTK